MLLIDDERAVLAALRLAFEDMDRFLVLTAASAEEALSLDTLREVDLVITDKNLPGMSGLDLIAVCADVASTCPPCSSPAMPIAKAAP